MAASRKEILSWVAKGNEDASNLVDLPWKITETDNVVILQNDQVPFSIFLTFGEAIMRMHLRSGIETAVLENQPRLSIYRTLLLLNRQLDLVKFMLEGMNEEVVARVDLELVNLSKEEFNDGMNTLLSSIYLMVRALKLEDQFREGITQRMIMMVQDMIRQGKTREDILAFLTDRIGLPKDQAEQVLKEMIGSADDSKIGGLYG
ncbi:MAG: hypothetical protein AAE983_02690 [Thermoplasmataceae archaeon]|jgi:hypothetical protein